MSSVDRALLRALRRALGAALGPSERIGVACSGGADSMALAHAAQAVWGDRVMVLHVDHQLQVGSRDVAERVAAWAAQRGLATATVRVRVAKEGSVEAAARKVRYAALRRLARVHGLRWILTAHTERDVAETILMRLVRGTDLAGLRAIAPRRGIVCRPWLEIRRAEVEAYVARHALPVWEDPMNADRAFMRARLRHDVMPLLAREHPGVEAALARASRHLSDWYRATGPQRRHAWRAAVLPASALDRNEAGAPRLRADIVARMPAAIARWVVAKWLKAVAGQGALASQRDAVVRACAASAAKRVSVGGGVVVKEFAVASFVPAASGVRVTTCAEAPPFAAPRGYAWRRWRAGDRMRPVRLKGRSAKLSDLFAQARVVASARPAAWILAHSERGDILWAQYLGAAFDAPENLVDPGILAMAPGTAVSGGSPNGQVGGKSPRK